jgi:hypothetical protein
MPTELIYDLKINIQNFFQKKSNTNKKKGSGRVFPEPKCVFN